MKKNYIVFFSVSAFFVSSLFISCGSLSYAVNGANLAGHAVKKQMAKNQKAEKLPEAFSKPSESFNDPDLSMDKIRAAISKQFQVDKIVVGPGNDYDVRKNEHGEILSKVTARYIIFSYRDNKTGKCYYNSCTFGREYEGGGNYGDLRFSADDNPVELTNCNEVN